MQLVFDKVTKYYGPVLGVNNVSCALGPGITGLLGSNGAGKSTLIKLASGQIRPRLGSVTLDGVSAWSTRAKRLFGYCPDVNSFYEEMTVGEFVLAMTSLYGYSRRESRQRTDRALEEVEMTKLSRRKLAACSHGMRQRVKLAQALVHDPPLLLLDEPLTGIDPGGRHHMNQLLRRQAAQGKTIVVSTHLLDEVDAVADQIMFVSRGRLMALGDVTEIRQHLSREPLLVAIDTAEPRSLAARLVNLVEVVTVALRDGGIDVSVSNPAPFFASLGGLLGDERWRVSRVETLDANTAAVFGYLERRAP
ncbi:MAG: ABC transporter ATP-binding protein [Planctomycetes bacterium]|nr:ABC transporter ATP-binding protein [Planctomycetota bacterium]